MSRHFWTEGEKIPRRVVIAMRCDGEHESDRPELLCYEALNLQFVASANGWLYRQDVQLCPDCARLRRASMTSQSPRRQPSSRARQRDG